MRTMRGERWAAWSTAAPPGRLAGPRAADRAAAPRRPTTPGTDSPAACAAARRRRSRRCAPAPPRSGARAAARETAAGPRAGPPPCRPAPAPTPRRTDRAARARRCPGDRRRRGPARRPRRQADSPDEPGASVRRPSGVHSTPLDGIHHLPGAGAVEQLEGQPADREDLVGSEGGIDLAGLVVGVDHVVEVSATPRSRTARRTPRRRARRVARILLGEPLGRPGAR